MVAFDPDVTLFACRDIDSVPTSRDYRIMEKFAKSSDRYLAYVVDNDPSYLQECFRDLGAPFMLAGMWGGKGGADPRLWRLMLEETFRIANETTCGGPLTFGVDEIALNSFQRELIRQKISIQRLKLDPLPDSPKKMWSKWESILPRLLDFVRAFCSWGKYHFEGDRNNFFTAFLLALINAEHLTDEVFFDDFIHSARDQPIWIEISGQAPLYMPYATPCSPRIPIKRATFAGPT